MHLTSILPESVVNSNSSLATIHALEPFERVSNERKRHISRVFLAQSLSLGAMSGSGVFLGNLINGEIGNVDIGLQVWLERRADGAKLVPIDAFEEGVGFDFLAAVGAGLAAHAVGDVAE